MFDMILVTSKRLSSHPRKKDKASDNVNLSGLVEQVTWPAGLGGSHRSHARSKVTMEIGKADLGSQNPDKDVGCHAQDSEGGALVHDT